MHKSTAKHASRKPSSKSTAPQPAPRRTAPPIHAPEPYFIIGGKERSGYRNARAAAKREPVSYVILGDQTAFGALAEGESATVVCPALRTPRSGPRYQTELRLAREEMLDQTFHPLISIAPRKEPPGVKRA